MPSGRPLRILFSFENVLPSAEADAEVFISTARALRPHLAEAWFHVPLRRGTATAIRDLTGLPLVPALAPGGPGLFRHLCCGLFLPFRRAFRRADLVYTRNLWVAWIATLVGKPVAFDHYRPWPDQVPPLRPLLYRLHRRPSFLVNICHSEYTRRAYASLGVPAETLDRIWNGFDPARIGRASRNEARRAIELPLDARVVVYTGRLNHRKGLGLVLRAAALLPDTVFMLVGSQGSGPIEAAATDLPNIRVVSWQPPDALGRFIAAADILLIPPSSEPLERFGSTVLPLKLFLYLASGRPILAGRTPDVEEVLRDGVNALLCPIDDPDALVAAIRRLLADRALADGLAADAVRNSEALTWDARAVRIVDALERRLGAPRSPAGDRERRLPRRAWWPDTRRWLVHLLRRRSWVLPPTSPARSGTAGRPA